MQISRAQVALYRNVIYTINASYFHVINLESE